MILHTAIATGKRKAKFDLLFHEAIANYYLLNLLLIELEELEEGK